MTQSSGEHPPRLPRPSLRRARKERLLFGVCGGVANYFGLDPTLVRAGVAVAGLVPPLTGMLLVVYAIMVVFIPEEGAERLAGREQVRDNLASLRTEVVGLAETVRARITGEPRATAGPAETPDDAAATAEPVEPAPAAPAVGSKRAA